MNTKRVQQCINLSIFVGVAASAIWAGAVLNQMSTIQTMEKNYLISKLESLNTAKTPVERALFKEFESCIEDNRWTVLSMAKRAEYGGLWLVFEEALADVSFNQQAEQCLNSMTYDAAYQKEALSNISKVKDIVTKFETIKLMEIK